MSSRIERLGSYLGFPSVSELLTPPPLPSITSLSHATQRPQSTEPSGGFSLASVHYDPPPFPPPPVDASAPSFTSFSLPYYEAPPAFNLYAPPSTPPPPDAAYAPPAPPPYGPGIPLASSTPPAPASGATAVCPVTKDSHMSLFVPGAPETYPREGPKIDMSSLRPAKSGHSHHSHRHHHGEEVSPRPASVPVPMAPLSCSAPPPSVPPKECGVPAYAEPVRPRGRGPGRMRQATNGSTATFGVGGEHMTSPRPSMIPTTTAGTGVPYQQVQHRAQVHSHEAGGHLVSSVPAMPQNASASAQNAGAAPGKTDKAAYYQVPTGKRPQGTKPEPPVRHKPFFTIAVTVVEIVIYVYELIATSKLSKISFGKNPWLWGGIDSYTVIDIGGKYAPYILQRKEWWRFFTPIFMHVSLPHIIMNLLTQLKLGIDMERSYGTWRIFAIYMLSGISGNVLSAIFLYNQIQAGASGALFGFMALLLVDLLLNWKLVVKPVRNLVILVISIVISLAVGLLPGVDNFAHLGGFFMGIFSGFLFLPSLVPGRAKCGSKRWVAILVSGPIVAAIFIVEFVLFYAVVGHGNSSSNWCKWCSQINCASAILGEKWCSSTIL